VITDAEVVALIADGTIRVDVASGRIFRLKTLSCYGTIVTYARPRRADKLDVGTGYRRFYYRRTSIVAHKVVWIAAHGPVPEGYEVNHIDLNKNRNCLANLELLTHLGNVQHAIANGHRARVYRGEDHPNARLRRVEVDEIRRELAAGTSKRSLARRFGVSATNIRHIAKGTKWAPAPENA
jgi:hypothetical protein